MASDKRDMTDFAKFPGEITDRGWYEFPTLKHIDSKGNTRIWNIQIRLIKEGDIKKYDVDWNILEQNEVPLLQKYIEGENLPKGTISQIWSEDGIIGGKITRHQPSHPTEVNIGRANERNTLFQAMISGRAKWQKKIDAGSLTNDEFEKMSSCKVDAHDVDFDHDEDKDKKNAKGICKLAEKIQLRYYPMLLHKYDQKIEYVIYPALMQPKCDGIRALAFLNISSPRINLADATYENVEIYTRQLKNIIGYTNQKKELLPILKELFDEKFGESVYMDGEMYTHGMNLQQLSGIVRNPKRNENPEETNEYYIFDCFYPDKLSIPFSDRFMMLKKIFSDRPSDKIRLISTVKVKTQKSLESQYRAYLRNKYEGAIIRNMDGEYLADPISTSSKLRSYDVLKLKPKYSGEFKIIDFKEGKRGKDMGAIIWICQTDGGHNFSITPKNVTNEWRKEMFTKLSKNKNKIFIDKYEGRMMTVEYDELSKKGIPLRAKALEFRDIE